MAIKSNSSKASFKRYLSSKPEMKKIKATFNGETITGNYVLLDARSPEEKAADKADGSLKGPVLVFFQVWR